MKNKDKYISKNKKEIKFRGQAIPDEEGKVDKFWYTTDEVGHAGFWGLVEAGTLINVCQYTTLKDINDTEIYEGDILVYDDPEEVGCNHDEISWIEWEDGSVVKKTLYIIGKEVDDEGVEYFGGEFGDNHLMKVIGNIYQNRKLLPVKDLKNPLGFIETI